MLLQNMDTRLFYAGPRQWIDDPTQAQNLKAIEDAAQAYVSENLINAEIVVEHRASGRATRLPIRGGS